MRPPFAGQAPARRLCSCLLLLLCLATVHSTMAQYSISRVYRYRQTSAANVQLTGCTVVVGMNSTVVGGNVPASARLTGPGITLELPARPAPLNGYGATRTYTSVEEMNREFPSGGYTFTLGTQTLSFTADLSTTVSPPRILNFDGLQEWPGGTLDLRWSSLTAVMPAPGFGVSLSKGGLTAVFYPAIKTTISSIGRADDVPPEQRATYTVAAGGADGLTFANLPPVFESTTGEITATLGLVANGNSSVAPGAIAVIPLADSGTVNLGMEVALEFPIKRANTAPRIISQPESRVVAAGAPVTFQVSATSGTYQWQRNGTAIAGATNSTYTIGSVQAADAGEYRVVVTNAFGSTTSAVATLALSNSSGPGTPTGPVIEQSSGPPVITTQPVAVTIFNGESFEFALGAKGQGPMIFQWYKNGVALGGFRQPTYAMQGARFADAGRYSVTVQNDLGTVTSIEAELVVLSVPRLSNLSVRAPVGGNAGPLTIGLNVASRSTAQVTGGATASVMIRGVGPGLVPFGVADVLADPKLEVFTGNALIVSNDNWPDTAQFAAVAASVGAFPLGGASKDAAAVVTLPAGNHTVRISGPGDSSGVALGEVYVTTSDNDFSAFSPKLTNLSALTLTGADANKLSVGFTIAGTGTRTVLIRGVGPGLAAVGVPSGYVANPTLTLYGAQGKISENDDWGGTTTLSNAFTSLGAFALLRDSKDAALLATLPAGSYTAEVSSIDGSTGLALIEIYEVVTSSP